MPARRAIWAPMRGRTVTAGEGALEDLDSLARAHGGVEGGEDAVGHRVAVRARLGLRAGRQDRVAHGGQVTQPLGVGRAVVVVGRRVGLGPGEQPGSDRGHVVGAGEGARPAADRRQHVEVALRVDLEQAAAHQVAGELGGLRDGRVQHVRQHAEADVEVEQPDAAQGGGAGLVEEVVRRVHRLVEADGGHRVAEPDERGLHGDLLDQQRQPTSGAQQATYLVRLLGQVDLLSTGRTDAAEEQLDGRVLPAERAGRAPAAVRRGRRTRPAGRRSSAPSPPRGRRWSRRAPTGGPDRPPSCRGRGRRGRAGTHARRPRGRGHPSASRPAPSPTRGSPGPRRARRRSCAGCGRRPTRRPRSRLRRRGARAASCRCRAGPRP